VPQASQAKQLFEAGKVREAAQDLTAYLREHPGDGPARTFLFELLCFSGQYERAEKQLSALARDGKDAEMGAILYLAALHAEKTRHELFEKQDFPAGRAPKSPSGTLNGKPFETLRDADPDLGARLEVFAAGAYLWIPFEHIESVEIAPPTRLRDTLWTPALVRTGPAFKGTELGEVLLPAIYPFSWKDADGAVNLGRVTSWAADDEGHEYPSGQKILLMDEKEEVPFLEIRSLTFTNLPADGPSTAG
jgi:type VI secretion system protein ImpE